jgi:very-short-patch-repair endonuclease
MLGTLAGKHLKSHNVSAQQYRDMFPGFPTIVPRTRSEETREKHRQSMMGKKHSEITKAKIGDGNRGKKMSEEAIEKWRISYAEYIQEHGSPLKGRDRGPKFSALMSEIAKKRDPALVQEKLEQMWAARRGSKATEEQRLRYSAARSKYISEHPEYQPKLFNTNPEQEFSKTLDLLDIPYTRSFHLQNKVYDFLLFDKIIIELDGPYHRTLGFYISKDATIEEKVEKLRGFVEKDRIKDQLARSQGFLIYRIPVGRHIPKDWHNILVQQGFVEF